MAEPIDPLTAAQVAEILGVTSETVRAWIRSGRLQGGWLYGSRKMGHRIKRGDLVIFLRGTGQPDIADRVERGDVP